MKHMIRILLLFLAICSLTTGSAQEVKHVVLISIDGFRPEFYKEDYWPAANLKIMAEKGVYADEVRTIFPSVTYPSHTTLSTGVLPAEHGIYYNTEVGKDGKPDGWIYDHKKIRAKTIWQAAKEAGKTTASVSWPVTVNNPHIDYNIPEIWSFENPMDRRGATAKYANPRGLFEEAVAEATGKLDIDEYNLSSLRMDVNLGRIAGYIIEKYKPNLLTVHLPNTDGAQHREGRRGDLVKRAVAGADHSVGEIYNALEKAGILEHTAIIITGDHGFVTTHTSISPNLWLKENGLDDKAFFFSTGGSAFLHLKNGNDKTTVGKVRKMLEGLPLTQRSTFKVIEEKQIREMQGHPDVQLAISARRGFCFDNDTEGPLLKEKRGGKHGYYPDFHDIYTGFIGFGAGFEKEMNIPFMQLEDIPSIAALLLGIDFPRSGGMAYPGILKPELSGTKKY
ncbi:ectonucleotide pyrophosphatase/phosphodiesterase [Sinomicrobium kalidii]|uniref:alkaline phosphatase family protein n=1 Tax=Sinomicrobium kalidii TaxID=2900738 RepID=UPI001E5716EE|nr:ectonucleotide pyrophosphatase/phosphodiesterase [Sinomicrobium kalidii]UGU16456.1 ectonucleotide pyrophosphatase/phosphodiesterase [Sinomicrobium kalidii]